jgi:hypothetical protein
MTEQQIQKRIIDEYEAQNYYVIKLSKTNKNGIPDLLCLRADKKPVFIEVKKKNGVLSALQKHRIKELKKYDFDAFVLDHTKF